jgi:hypothetical protein
MGTEEKIRTASLTIFIQTLAEYVTAYINTAFNIHENLINGRDFLLAMA